MAKFNLLELNIFILIHLFYFLVKCSEAGPKRDLIERWIEWQLIIMYPITPHFNEIGFLENFLPYVDKSKYSKNLIEAKMP